MLESVRSSDAIEDNREAKEPKGRRIDRPKVYSLGLFLLASGLGIALLPDYIWFFIFLLAIDSVSTYLNVDYALIFDRVVFAAVLIVLTALIEGFSAQQLIFESFLLILLLDFSILLRRLGEGRYNRTIIWLRFRSYAFSLSPAYFLSLVLLIGYSSVNILISNAILVFGLASAGILVIVFFLARYSIRISSVPKEN